MKTKEILQKLQSEGKSYNEISRITGFSKANISYHLGVGQKAKTILRKRIQKNTAKETLVALKGGKCERCGYDKCIQALEFHHLDPTQKEFNLSTLRGGAIKHSLIEIEKCILLCSNCHKEEHFNNPLLAKPG